MSFCLFNFKRNLESHSKVVLVAGLAMEQ